MTVTKNNPQSWLDAIWESVWAYEQTFGDCLDSETSDKIDDMKTAMAWIAESLGLGLNDNGDYINVDRD